MLSPYTPTTPYWLEFEERRIAHNEFLDWQAALWEQEQAIDNNVLKAYDKARQCGCFTCNGAAENYQNASEKNQSYFAEKLVEVTESEVIKHDWKVDFNPS